MFPKFSKPFPYIYIYIYILSLSCETCGLCRLSTVRAIYTKSHFIVMGVYFILIKLCYFITIRIYMSYVCI